MEFNYALPGRLQKSQATRFAGCISNGNNNTMLFFHIPNGCSSTSISSTISSSSRMLNNMAVK